LTRLFGFSQFEFAGTLAVSDQHDAASMVVVLQIIFPGIHYIVVAQRPVNRHGLAGNSCAQSG